MPHSRDSAFAHLGGERSILLSYGDKDVLGRLCFPPGADRQQPGRKEVSLFIIGRQCTPCQQEKGGERGCTGPVGFIYNRIIL